jgi:antitoxin component HigA of HigAB toxin-antitoxin module
LKDGYYANTTLRENIETTGASIRDIATIIGYSKSHTYNILQGRVPCRVLTAERLSKYARTDFGLCFDLVESHES